MPHATSHSPLARKAFDMTICRAGETLCDCSGTPPPTGGTVTFTGGSLGGAGPNMDLQANGFGEWDFDGNSLDDPIPGGSAPIDLIAGSSISQFYVVTDVSVTAAFVGVELKLILLNDVPDGTITTLTVGGVTFTDSDLGYTYSSGGPLGPTEFTWDTSGLSHSDLLNIVNAMTGSGSTFSYT